MTVRLCVRFLGLDLLDIDLTTDSPSPEPEVEGSELAGGTLYADCLTDDGVTDRYMGFTNGREVGE